MRNALTVLAGLVALSVGASSAQAATTITRLPARDLGLVVKAAGDSVVTVTRGGTDEAPYVVTRYDPGGRRAVLGTVPVAPGEGVSATLPDLEVTPTTWAVSTRYVLEPRDIEDDSHADEPLSEIGELIVAGPVAGGPMTTVLQCTVDVPLDRDKGAGPSPELALSADRIAWSSSRCPGADGVRVAPLAGGPGAQVAAGGEVVGIGAAKVSVVTLTPQGFPNVLSQLDPVAGTSVDTDAKSVRGLAFEDGRLVAAAATDDPRCSSAACTVSIMRIAADGTIQRPGLAGVNALLGPVAGGGRVLATRRGGDGLVAVDLATGTRSYAAALGQNELGLEPLEVDATRAVYLTSNCEGDAEVHFETTVAAVPKPLSYVPCPVRFLSTRAKYHAADTFARIRFACPKGCDSGWEVKYQGRVIGEFFASARAGRSGSAHLDIDRPKAFGHRHTVTVKLVSDDAVYTFARRQPAIALRLDIQAV